MYRINFVILVFLISAVTILSQNHFKKYPIKSGIIHYKWEGFIKGTQITYFDDYGYYEATYQDTKSTMMGFTTESKTITIMKGAEQVTINPETKTGVRTINPYLESFEDNPNKNYEDVSKKMIKNLGYEKTGKGEILGKTCEIFKGMGEIWIWNGISLKTTTDNMGIEATVTATEFIPEVNIPKEKFAIPSDVQVSDEDETMNGSDEEEMPEEAKDIMKNLKNMFKSDED